MLILLITGIAALSAAVGRIHSRMTELVVAGALFFIRKDFVGLAYLLEFCLRSGITGVQVRVVLLCKLAVSFFYLIVRCGLRNAEHLVIITLFRQNPSPYFFLTYAEFYLQNREQRLIKAAVHGVRR